MAACVCVLKACHEKRTIVETAILRLSSRRWQFDVLKNEQPEDGNIMDYPVLGHYDPSVEATAESGGDEQELLCEYFLHLFELSFFLVKAPGTQHRAKLWSTQL